MTPTTQFHLRIPVALLARLKALAAADRRTVSDWARLALERAADKAEAAEEQQQQARRRRGE